MLLLYSLTHSHELSKRLPFLPHAVDPLNIVELPPTFQLHMYKIMNAETRLGR
jgi:hypothetical protein